MNKLMWDQFFLERISDYSVMLHTLVKETPQDEEEYYGTYDGCTYVCLAVLPFNKLNV